MVMKNLTHYFKSPKEDEKEQKVKPTQLPIEVVEENVSSKKRKISLSKSKKNKNDNSSGSTNNVSRIESKEPQSPEQILGQTFKKRKIEDDPKSPSKKIKTKTTKLKRSANKVTVNQVASLQKAVCESNDKPLNIVSEKDDKASFTPENSLSNDEPLVRRGKNSKKNLFIESDDEEPEIIQTKSPPSAEKNETNGNNCNVSSRHSLFSYFNKVDKETALKQQKTEKLEVKAIVHFSPSGTKIERQSLDKKNSLRKPKKHKKNLQLDDSDSIEVISSEEIIDENSSTKINLLSEAQQHQENSLSPALESAPNNVNSPNLASIFLPKKGDPQPKNAKNISLTREEKEISPQENFDREKKELKSSKQKKSLSKSRKIAKKIKGLQNEKSKIQHLVDDVNESSLVVKKVVQEEVKDVRLIDKSSALKINKSTNELPTNIKDDIEIVNPANNQIPRSEKTPKKNGSKINGYFTPKSNTVTKSDINSSEKLGKNAKSPWVMKVCLNSASKNLIGDSDEEDYGNSQDSGKGESEPLCLAQDESRTTCKNNGALSVVDEDDDSSVEVIECNDDDDVKNSLTRNTKKPKEKTVEEKQVIEDKPPTPKPTVKLWPFFQKGGARQVKEAPIDEKRLKAKALFLESGIPESIKRKVESVKSDISLGSPAPFPTISHVVQRDENIESRDEDSRRLLLPPDQSVSPPPVVPTWTPLLTPDPLEEPEIPVFERPGNVKAFLEKLKEEEPKTEVKVLYKKLKEYKRNAESDIWTEVYKPTDSADMVGNSENIKKLKTWLETLKNCRKREGSVSSGDEFVNEDSDGEDNSFNNMAVICGPCGCGKTSAVYAIAKELDIKVLEINASCNRSGKRILAEFSESTQSHHVERSQSVNGLFNNQSSGKKKRKKLKTAAKSKSEKTSLILVEDADLLFTDCDEGFVPALASLAATSKRPIVLVTNQANTPHLDRFNNSKLLRITFNRPRPNKISLWLRLVGLVEGVMMSQEVALRLVTLRSCDVRRCLLQLQLMVHSNNSEVKATPSVRRLWWEWPGQYQLSYELPTLLEPEGEEEKPKTDKKLLLSQLQSVALTCRRLAQLDVLATGSREECLEDHEDPCPLAWTAKWRDSTTLTAPSASSLYSCEEATWLLQAMGNGHQQRPGQTAQEARWLSILRQGEQFFMNGVSMTAHTNHHSVTCDYFPMLRELGRSEQVRLANYTRRANRFFNYLQGLGIHATKSYRDFMCDAFT